MIANTAFVENVAAFLSTNCGRVSCSVCDAVHSSKNITHLKELTKIRRKKN